jgi:hypothetical protein
MIINNYRINKISKIFRSKKYSKENKCSFCNKLLRSKKEVDDSICNNCRYNDLI